MKTYYDTDASLEPLRNKTLAILGYGNQGRAQALNLRDSGLRVIVGNVRDQNAQQAERDGFQVLSIAEAAEQGDLLALLIPDEIQPQVFSESIASHLRAGQVLDFATGYNVHYRLIVPPRDVDVIMVAPRMMGATVREWFVRGRGAPAFLAVAQDASGQARQIALAWARGIGATRAGVLETTFAEETELDLFQEQAFWPVFLRTMTEAFEFLVAKGFPPEIVAVEMYGTGEAAEIFREMARQGVFKQMRYHSPTSRYGTLSNAQRLSFAADIRAHMEKTLAGLRDGGFVEEWQKEQAAGYPVFQKLLEQAEAHPLNQVEENMRKLLKFSVD